MSLFASLILAATAATAITPTLSVQALPATASVDVADLDFSNPADVKTFDARARIAVKQVCGEASPADLVGQNQVDACRVETRSALNIQRDSRIAAATGQNPVQALALSASQ